MTYTFIELAKDTLEHAGISLSHVELWQKACELGLDKKLSSVGKTPWESISARLYVDMRDNTNSIFCKVGKRPVRFALKSFSQKVINTSEEEFEKNTAKEKNAEFNERDLHPLLSYFVAYHEHFKCSDFLNRAGNRKRGTMHRSGRHRLWYGRRSYERATKENDRCQHRLFKEKRKSWY